MKKYRIAPILFPVFLLILMGCAASPTESFEGQVETLVASTLDVYTPLPAQPSLTPIPTFTPEFSTPDPLGEVYVYTVFQNVNLRTNPGELFTVSRVMAQSTQLLLLGQVPGGEWLRVRNNEGITGWVNVDVVSMTYDGSLLPIIEPTDVYLVTGHVETELNTPVSGIGFAITQGSRRTDAITDENGQFYAYLPRSMSGTWEVSFVSVSCRSNTMDDNCNCINDRCGSGEPLTVNVVLPQSEELNFIWR